MNAMIYDILDRHNKPLKVQYIVLSPSTVPSILSGR